MKSLALYPIYIPEVVQPNYTLQKAFERHFSPCYTYDWLSAKKRLGKIELAQKEFIEILKATKPDYSFVQLQNPDNMTVEMIREMAKYTKIINWSGDIRITKPWYDWFEAIGKEIYLSTFSNVTDVELMQGRGVRADYLQVGYDTGFYYPDDREKTIDIVFSAHNYGNFPMSKYRQQVAVALRDEFGEGFKLFGGNWEKFGFKSKISDNYTEAEAYRSAKIGISVSNFSFKRYHSDRLLRIMGCGCLPMSHWYEGIELDYDHDENIAIFNDIPNLIEECKYYLNNEDVRKIVARNAYLKAITDCTWDSRCKELIQLIEKWG